MIAYSCKTPEKWFLVTWKFVETSHFLYLERPGKLHWALCMSRALYISS